MPLDATPARRGRRKRHAQPIEAADHGPANQHRTGRLEVVDAADPDAPSRTIRRARVVWHYDTAHRNGHLSDPEREACDRYLILCDREDGAQERRDGPSVRAAPWNRAPALSAIQAAASLRAAHAAVGPDGAALLRLYVRDNLPADEIARRRNEGRDVITGRIRAAIRRLAEHWGMT